MKETKDDVIEESNDNASHEQIIRVSLEKGKLQIEEEKDNSLNWRDNNTNLNMNKNSESSKHIESGKQIALAIKLAHMKQPNTETNVNQHNFQRKSIFAGEKQTLNEFNVNDITIVPLKEQQSYISQQNNSQSIQKKRRLKQIEAQKDFNSFEHTLFQNYGGVSVSNKSTKSSNNNNKGSQKGIDVISPTIKKSIFMLQDSVLSNNNNNYATNSIFTQPFQNSNIINLSPVLNVSCSAPDSSRHCSQIHQSNINTIANPSQISNASPNFINFSNAFGNNNNNNHNNSQTSHNQISFINNGDHFSNTPHNDHTFHINQEPEQSGELDSMELIENDEGDSLLSKVKNHKQNKNSPTNSDDIFEQDTQQFVETKIGRNLSELTTQRVILLIFSLVMSVPILSDSTWIQSDISYETGFQSISDYSNPLDSFPKQIQDTRTILNYFIDYHNGLQIYELIYLSLGNTTIFNTDLNQNLRDSEKASFFYDQADALPPIIVLYSFKEDSDLSSLLSIIQTTFLIFLLSFASYYFAKDSNEMLVDPIERMLIKIQLISRNPLEAARLAEDEAIAQAELNAKGLLSYDSQFETHILESTIIKIGALLALGFGEAGSEIIAKNMNKDGLVNPMIPGRKVMAIFGFVAIRNFADATEVLQENVMLFANEIAEIVHNVCDAFHGTANKNLGDCFLMVWKFKEGEEVIYLNKQEEVCINNLPVCQSFTDLALFGFLKTISNSYKLGQTKRFMRHTIEIQKSNPSFSLKLGFGLHLGWGIEGSIGSQFKIDASYLSPNVNMASRLENATKQYGLQLLLSGAVYNLLSPVAQQYLRHVDRVTVKGSKQPMDLYTCDMDPKLMCVNQLEQQSKKIKEQNKKIFRFVYRKKKDRRLDKIVSGKIQVSKLFTTDQDLVIMRQNHTKEFMDTFHEGIGYYLDGDWKEATQWFHQAQEILTQNTLENYGGEILVSTEDGPIKTLITYMKNYNFQAPEEWCGFRELKDK